MDLHGVKSLPHSMAFRTNWDDINFLPSGTYIYIYLGVYINIYLNKYKLKYTHIFKLIHDFRYLPESWVLCWSILLGHKYCLNRVQTQTRHPMWRTSKRNWRQRKSLWQNEMLKTERDEVMIKGELLSSPGLINSPAYFSLPREH